MARRACWCLRQWARGASGVVIVCGVAMIGYALWLMQRWNTSVSLLPSSSTLPKPWFIQACFGAGISVCLSTLFAHIIVLNSSSNASLLICIVFVICALLLVEVASVITVFFRMHLVERFSELMDESQEEFKNFLIFNIALCRLIAIVALVPQICGICVVSILWGVGGGERMRRSNSYLWYLEQLPDFRQSFLVSPRHEGVAITNNSSPLQGFVPYLIAVFRTRFPPTPSQIGA